MKATIANLQKTGYQYLRNASIEKNEALENVKLLLCHLLEFEKKSELYRNRNQVIDHSKRLLFYSHLRRRRLHEPLQYILGESPFLDMQLEVNPSCLIPRPETERLVEAVENLIYSHHPANQKLRLLDVGTGSGNIPISLAKSFPKADIWAIDISEQALQVAKKNVASQQIENVRFLQNNLLDGLKSEERFFILTANLPYLSESEWKDSQMELKWEPKQALVAGKNGLELVEKFIQQAPDFLKDKGWLLLEIGMKQAKKVRMLLKDRGFHNIQVLKDYQRLNRIVIAQHTGQK